jgi:hypothetical protein
MPSITIYVCASLILATGFSDALGQGVEKSRAASGSVNEQLTQTLSNNPEKNDEPKPGVEQPRLTWIHLVGGRRMQVDELTQTSDGVWYKQGNVSTFIDKTRVVKIEREEDREPDSLPNAFAGSGKWNISDSVKIENFFLARFKRPLPFTAFGQSELHTRWGLDHRHGMDVGLHPDSLEGKALIKFLLSEEIPFLAFRGSVPGVATGPHIHIGNGSQRLRGR